MKKALPVLAVCLLTAVQVQARDDRNRYSIEAAMGQKDATERLSQNYTYRFGNQPHAAVVTDHGGFTSNKKTNAFTKSDKEACQWVFLSAMLSFQDRITKEGGNAVINLRSYYKKNDFVSDTEFECGNGAIMAGVTFVGDVVTLAE